jgi:hypothetical protein
LPPQLGGNGHITAEIFEDADIERLLTAALAPDADLVSFFLGNHAR